MSKRIIWDGNGGTLDPDTASHHDLLVALNVKMDSMVIPGFADHEARLRGLEKFRYAVPSAVLITLALSIYYFATQ